MTLRVIRNKNTKEVRVMWRAPQDWRHFEPTIDCGPDEEYVELRNMTYSTAWRLACEQAGGRPGRIHVYNDRIEAYSPPARPSGLLGELYDLCRRTGKEPADITLKDIEDESHRRAKLEHATRRVADDPEAMRRHDLKLWREDYQISEHPTLRSGFAPRLRMFQLAPGRNPRLDRLPQPQPVTPHRDTLPEPPEDVEGLW